MAPTTTTLDHHDDHLLDIDARRRLAAELLTARSAILERNANANAQQPTDVLPDTVQLDAAAAAAMPAAEAQPLETTALPDETASRAAMINAAANPPLPDAVRGVGCAGDLKSFCKREANILALLENVPSGIDAANIAHAIQNVQLCMTKNIEALSPSCIDALVADMVNEKRDAVTPATFESVPGRDANTYPQSVPSDEDSSVEVSIHYSKHHNAAGLRGANHAALVGAAPALKPPQPLASGDSSMGSPLLWLVVFPFFCVGVYTAYNHALVYLRRRRDIFRVESKQYTPLP